MRQICSTIESQVVDSRGGIEEIAKIKAEIRQEFGEYVKTFDEQMKA